MAEKNGGVRVTLWRNRLASGELTAAEESFFVDRLLGCDRAQSLECELESTCAELAKDHRQRRRHASLAFIVACCLMTSGILAIVIACLAGTFGLALPNQPAALVAGVITEAVSLLPFYVWRQASSCLESSSARLSRQRDLLRAVRMASTLPKRSQHAVYETVIRRLASAS